MYFRGGAWQGGYGLPIGVLGSSIAAAVIERHSMAMYACLVVTWITFALVPSDGGGARFRVGGGFILALGIAALIRALYS